MATCEKLPVVPIPPPPSIYVLTLSEDEARALALYLTGEKWPSDGSGKTLNRILREMREAGVR